ncbi:ATP-binding protein [Aliiroseovarius sp. S253]|uniref:ATP-binding protein n=1 Tax=Aliiroseovarius sp. S253 TaxID=3415133 RepID=UPI003C7A3EDA
MRQALEQVLALALSADEKSVVEIVLAEVLNNIVEHAYQEDPTGRIDLYVEHSDTGFRVLVQDEGLPLPEDLPNKPVDYDLSCDNSDLPEGGFGWLLVRELTDGLHYERRNGRNILSFWILNPEAKQA